MEFVGLAITGLAALGIFVIGMLYLVVPRWIADNFGLPSVPSEPDTPWLRLKGVRDVTVGAIAGVLLLTATSTVVGWVLLTAAAIPLGDAAIVIRSRGSVTTALGVHGTTAAMMLVGAILLLAG